MLLQHNQSPISKKRKHNRGSSLIEVIITVFIITLAVVSIYQLFSLGLKTLGQNKARQTAMILAEEKIEYVRNLPYDDIGTQTGIPQGTIPSTETVAQNGMNFTVSTDIVFVDDPFDGTIDSNPEDNLFTDYKSVRINISWPNSIPQAGITLFTDVSPQGLETATAGGTLLIVVSNASGESIAGAAVQLSSASLGINEEYTTDDRGEVLLPGAPAGEEAYDVAVTKSGYSRTQTYQRTQENPEPTDPPLTVRDGQKTTASFKIDLISSLIINTISQDIANNWQVNTDSDSDEQTTPSIAMDADGNYYFVWEDNRLSGSTRIYLQKYNAEFQKQWTEDIQISTSTRQTTPQIAVDGGNNLYIVWGEESQGNQEIYLQKYDDTSGTAIWNGPKKVSTDENSKDQFYPNIIIDNANRVYLVWVDNRNSDLDLDIFLQQFNSDGDRVFSTDVKVNTDTYTTNDIAPALSKDSEDNIYIAWQDNLLSDNDIYWQKISSGGTAQWSQEKIANLLTSTDQGRPRIAADSLNNLYFVWQDMRNGNYDIYAQKYTSSGALITSGQWGGSDLKINSGSNYGQKDPCIAIFQDLENNLDTVYVAWTDLQNNDDIYAQKLNTDGNAQWLPEAKMNTDVGLFLQNSSQCITNLNGELIVAWQDNRNGDFDIYAGSYNGAGSIVSRGSVPLEIKGAKQIGNDPIILKYTKQKTTNGAGVLSVPDASDPNTELEWDEYTLTIPSESGYTMKSIDPAQPIVLEPNSTVTVTVTVE